MFNRRMLTDVGLAALLAAPSFALAHPADPPAQRQLAAPAAAVELAEAVNQDSRDSRLRG